MCVEFVVPVEEVFEFFFFLVRFRRRLVEEKFVVRGVTFILFYFTVSLFFWFLHLFVDLNVVWG